MAVINKTGISNGATIQSEHITRVIDALSGVSTDSILATGSFTGSFNGLVTSASYALTASYSLNGGGGGTSFPYTGSAIISGSLIVTGSVLGQYGFTGSLQGTSSISVTSSFSTTTAGVNLTDTTTGTGPYYPVFSSTTAGGAILRTDTSTFTYNATTNTLTATSSYATQGLSSSFATSASISSNASGIVAIPGSTYNLTDAGRVTGNGLILPTTQPAQPIEGSVYFDPGTQTLNVYYNSAWYGITLTVGG